MKIVFEYVKLPDMESRKFYIDVNNLSNGLQFDFTLGLKKVVYTYPDHYELFYLKELE
jgi:hypothetical protein